MFGSILKKYETILRRKCCNHLTRSFFTKGIPRFDYFLFSQQYHEFATNTKGSNVELATPVEDAINKNNVREVAKAILNAYCYDTPESPYRTIKASLTEDSCMLAYLNLERSLMD